MKKIFNIIGFAFFPFFSFAQENPLEQARQAYADGDFQTAIEIYEGLKEQGVAPELFYNLGNAYYKNNQNGKAILNFERALRLNPDFEDAQFNLAFVNSKIQDTIEPKEEFFLVEWAKMLGATLSSNAWARLSVVMFSLMLIFALGFAFAPWRWARQTAFYLALTFFFVSFFSFLYAKNEKKNAQEKHFAIILTGSVTLKSSPDESGTEVFVLHEGTKVQLRNRLGEWVEVQIADGNTGWMREQYLEQI